MCTNCNPGDTNKQSEQHSHFTLSHFACTNQKGYSYPDQMLTWWIWRELTNSKSDNVVWRLAATSQNPDIIGWKMIMSLCSENTDVLFLLVRTDWKGSIQRNINSSRPLWQFLPWKDVKRWAPLRVNTDSDTEDDPFVVKQLNWFDWRQYNYVHCVQACNDEHRAYNVRHNKDCVHQIRLFMLSICQAQKLINDEMNWLRWFHRGSFTTILSFAQMKWGLTNAMTVSSLKNSGKIRHQLARARTNQHGRRSIHFRANAINGIHIQDRRYTKETCIYWNDAESSEPSE